MNVYNEIKQIAKMNDMQTELINKLVEKDFETDGLDFKYAYFVRNCTEEDGHLYNYDGGRLDNSGLVDGDYYCKQYKGYCEDDFYGTIYCATDEEGLFVAIPFAM